MRADLSIERSSKSFEFDAGDLSGFVIEDSDAAVRARRDDSGGQVLQQSLVIDLRVLDFGKQLRVFDRDRELAAENLKRVLLDAAVDAAREPRAKQHDSGEVFAGKDAHRDRDVERPPSAFHRFQLWSLPHPMQLIQNKRFLMRFQVFDNRRRPLRPSLRAPRPASRKRVLLRETVLWFGKQDENAIGGDGPSDGLGKTFQQVLQAS